MLGRRRDVPGPCLQWQGRLAAVLPGRGRCPHPGGTQLRRPLFRGSPGCGYSPLLPPGLAEIPLWRGTAAGCSISLGYLPVPQGRRQVRRLRGQLGPNPDTKRRLLSRLDGHSGDSNRRARHGSSPGRNQAILRRKHIQKSAVRRGQPGIGLCRAPEADRGAPGTTSGSRRRTALSSHGISDGA